MEEEDSRIKLSPAPAGSDMIMLFLSPCSLYESMAGEPRLTPEGANLLRRHLSWHPGINREGLADGGVPGQFRQALWSQKQRLL